MKEKQKYIVLLLMFLIGTGNILAQDKQEKVRPKLRLNYIHKMDGKSVIKANAYYKAEDEKFNCEGAIISLISEEDSEDPITQATVDEDGFASLFVPESKLKLFEVEPNQYLFYVRLEPDDKYKESSADLEVWHSELSLDLFEEDSTKYVKAIFICRNDTGEVVPCPDIPIKFYVKRALGLFPVGDDFVFTDEEGQAQIEFPQDLPGDEKGAIQLLVKVDEDETYGTVEKEAVIDWGIKSEHFSPVEERTLIGGRNNAPWFIVAGVNVILIGIWIFLFYMIHNLYHIAKIGKRHKDISE